MKFAKMEVMKLPRSSYDYKPSWSLCGGQSFANENYKPCLYPHNPSLEDELKRLFADFTVQQVSETRQRTEGIREEFKQNGLDTEYCPELEKGIIPTAVKKSKKNKKPLPTECVFCKNNGEDVKFYSEHVLKDQDGRVVCPVLRRYTCPICLQNGDNAHTLKYCPENRSGDVTSPVQALKESRNSTGKRRSR